MDYIDLTGEFAWAKRKIHKYGMGAKSSNARVFNFGGAIAALTDCDIYSGIRQ